MRRKLRSLLSLAFAAVLGSLLLNAQSATGAILLPGPGVKVALPGTTALGGTLIATMVSPFADNNGLFTGTLTSWVYKSDPNNALNGLTFVYQLANNGPNSLKRITINGWGTSPVVNVDRLASPSLASTANRLASGGIGFDWVGLIPGASFGTVVVHTGLNSYTQVIANIIDGGIATAPTFAAVPEPTTVIAGALLLLPFAASTWRRIKK